MNITFRKTIVLICLCIALFSTLTHAGKRKFQIDVLVIQQNGATSENTNAPHSSLHWPKKMIEPGEKTTKSISASSSTLAKAASILAKKPQYSILLHQSWEQAISSQQSGDYVHIQGKGVNGFVQLRRSHNLHLNIGMEYPTQSGENTFVIAEKRRILLNKKHYFDHPRIGVITNVSPL
jgi:hypothetical protein